MKLSSQTSAKQTLQGQTTCLPRKVDDTKALATHHPPQHIRRLACHPPPLQASPISRTIPLLHLARVGLCSPLQS